MRHQKERNLANVSEGSKKGGLAHLARARHWRSRASISLLGCFNVRDKDGNDITSNFTPRLKHLLILLILYTEKNAQGILASKTTEILWPDKEETAARNNRNVNLRKLRVLLESIQKNESLEN